jgi:hypothetical protein
MYTSRVSTAVPCRYVKYFTSVFFIEGLAVIVDLHTGTFKVLFVQNAYSKESLEVVAVLVSNL